MQKFSNIITKAAAAILAVILAAGCVFEKEDPTATRDVKNVLVQIGVNTSGMIQTRADAVSGGTETATETEINTLRVYAYVGGVLSGYLYATDVDTENHALLMDVKLPAAGNATIDFVAVANETGMTAVGDDIAVTVGRNTDGTLTFSKNVGMTEFNEITYTLEDQEFANGMPMYATGQTTIDVDKVSKQNTAEGHEGHFILTDKINIELTRSLSKVAVYAAEEGTSESNNVKINSVKISNVISSGYLFPPTTYPTATQEEATISNTAVTVTKKLNRTDEDFATKRVNPANFTLVTATPYYIPENGSGTQANEGYSWNSEVEGATKLTVNYTTGSGSAKDAVIYMPKIERNNFYKVLCLIKANGEMELVLNVQDWTAGTGATVNFADQVAFDTTYGLKWNGNNITGNTYSLPVAAGSEVTCSFQITAPVGGKWYATLTDGDIQNYEIEGGSGTIGETSSFKIKTRYSNLNSGSDKEVKLVITAVSKNGRSMVVNFNEAGYYIIKQNQM